MQKLFQQLGANQKEQESFLRLLELGAQPISVIAKHMGIPRSSMYLVIENLIKLGLVEEFEREGIKFVKCTPVEQLKNVLEARKRGIEQTEQLLADHLPELEALENKLSITPQVRFLEGKEGVGKMYEQVLKEDEFLACFNPELVKKLMPEYHYKIPESLRERGGKAKEMLVEGPEAKKYQQQFASKKHQIRLLPKSSTFPSDIIICANKMYMVAYGEDQVSATEIISPSLVETQRVLFELIWDKLTK